MPWTTADVDRHKKGLSDKQKETWVEIANSALKRCLDKGGSQGKCEGSAIRQADSVVGQQKEADVEYKAYTTSTNSVLITVNAIDVDGEAVPVAEVVAAYREQRGQGQGQGGERQGDGGADVCVCPKCGHEIPHEKGTPCNETECPECGAAMTGKQEEMGEATQKTVDGKKYPASDFLVVEDPEQPSTWHLQVKRNGKPDHGLMGGAKAALTSPGGHRGRKYAGPDKAKAISKLKALYKSEKMPWSEESAEVNIDKLQDLLREALDMLDGRQEEIAETQLSESASGHAIRLTEADPSVATGPRAPLLMDVALIAPGWGNKKDKHYYPSETLKRDARVFEGVKMYATDHRPEEKSVRTEVAVIKDCPTGFTAEGAPIARVAVHDGDFAEQARNRKELGTLGSLECSILALGRTKKGEVDGEEANIVEAITKGQSVDWVTKAGAGGHALNLAESNTGGVEMDKEQIEKLLSESDLPRDAQERLAGGEYEDEGAVKEAILKEQAQQAPQKLAEAEVEKLVEATNLPAAFRAALKTAEYEDEEAAKAAIAEAVKEIKALTGSGRPFAQGGSQPAQDKPLSEREKIIRFNKIMDRVGGRQVPVPAEQ